MQGEWGSTGKDWGSGGVGSVSGEGWDRKGRPARKIDVLAMAV